MGASNDYEFWHRLKDPPQHARPKTGKKTATMSSKNIVLTYGNMKQYELGTKNRNKEIRKVYQLPESQREALKVRNSRNTYVSHSNKTYEILEKKIVPQSKILEKNSNPIDKIPFYCLSGQLKVQM